MKTTIDFADDLSERLRERTKERGITLRSAIHEATLRWLDEENKPLRTPIDMRKYAVSGGLTPEAQKLSPSEIIEWSYDPDNL